jgi:tRNA pseudouridine38-40 synthase
MVDSLVYKLTLSYEGTNYHGWQVQPNGDSVQSQVEEALQKIAQEPIRIVGSGRTDAGVHALGQVAHFTSTKPLPIERLLFSLNALLPKDIRIITVENLDYPFHAQHHATSKIYRYHLHLGKVLDPFKRLFSWHVAYPFDMELLLQAKEHLLGTHDFTSFSNEAHRGVAARDPIRTIYRIDIIPEAGGIAIEFEGDGFLYKMVRNMVGTLVDCAIGKKDPSTIPLLFEAKNRKLGSMAAPPQGLFLVKVIYRS